MMIIAEVCQNHGGSRETLAQMINAAATAGATHVKMQTIFADDLTDRPQFETGGEESGIIKVIKRPYAPEYERLKDLELTEEDHHFFIDECKRHTVIPFTTIFARHRIPSIVSLPWPERVVKVASYDCGSFAMLRELTAHFDHLIVSTGASFDDEIKTAVQIVKDAGKKLTLLHCVTSYPNTLDMCHLKRMEWLRQFTNDVGWSDHTLVARDGLKASKAALALGATAIERHFTIKGATETKDGPVSITPKLLKELRAFADLTQNQRLEHAQKIPEWNIMLGQSERELSHQEKLNRDYYRGRFASKVNGQWVYNWEEKSVLSSAS